MIRVIPEAVNFSYYAFVAFKELAGIAYCNSTFPVMLLMFCSCSEGRLIGTH